jgi:hypothetical protein
MTEENNKEQNVTPISADELAKQEEVQAEEEQEKVEVDVVEEEPSKKEETDTTSENDSPEKSEEGEKENDKKNGEVPPSDEGNEGDGEGSEEVPEDVEGDTEKVEDKPVEENKQEEEPTESIEDLKAQIEEYKFNEEERAGLQNLATQIQNAQAELDDFDAKVDMALRDALVDNKIDLDKSLDELGKENPAAYKIAIDFIRQANQVKEQHAVEVTQKVRDVQNTLIFKRAEREFAKYNLTAEEAEVAADTFIKIMHEVGINDLNEDLKTKVSLSVGQSRINKVAEAPKVEEVVEEAPVEAVEDTSKTDEVAEEKPAEEETTKEEKKEEKPTEEPKKKVVVDLDEYMADPTTSAAGAKKSDYTDTSILSELAKLRGKEQQAFYVEHATEINKAMAEVRKNMGIGR